MALLRALVFDVGVGSEPTDRGALRVLLRDRSREVPEKFSSGVFQPKLDLVRLSGRERAQPTIYGAGQVVGVHDVLPTVRQQLRRSDADSGSRLLAHVVEPPIGERRPHLHRDGFAEETVAFLAVAKGV
ncbi:MAG: hypothetical protein RL701_281 [Pseudomonadota bacterium]